MFYENLMVSFNKQNMSEYLLNTIPKLKINPSYSLTNFMVQVINNQQISDCQTNFKAKFKKKTVPDNQSIDQLSAVNIQPKKGSIIRLVSYTLDLQNLQLFISDWQYLGGAGTCIIRNGRPWDLQKVKFILSSNVCCREFIVLHHGHNQNKKENVDLQIKFSSNGQNFKLKAAKESVFNIGFSCSSTSTHMKKSNNNRNLRLRKKLIKQSDNKTSIKKQQQKQIQAKINQNSQQHEVDNNRQKKFQQLGRIKNYQVKNDGGDGQDLNVDSQRDIEMVRKMKITDSIDTNFGRLAIHSILNPNSSYNYNIRNKPTIDLNMGKEMDPVGMDREQQQQNQEWGSQYISSEQSSSFIHPKQVKQQKQENLLRAGDLTFTKDEIARLLGKE